MLEQNLNESSRASLPSVRFQLLQYRPLLIMIVLALILILPGCSTRSLKQVEGISIPSVPVICRGVVTNPTPINPQQPNDVVRWIRQMLVVNEWHRDGLVECQQLIGERLEELNNG